ncbi:MAG: DNA polymerase III subunit alpha [Treponema sp.]
MDLYTYECPEGTPESKYIPLDVMSDFSIGESIARIPDLVKKAKSLNMKVLALTDRTLSGVIEFYLLCKHNNIKPIVGQKIAFGNNEVNLLCKDFEAYKILCSHSLEFQEANNCPITVNELPLSKYEASHFVCTSLYADKNLLELFGDNLYTQINFSDLKSHPEKIEKQDITKSVITTPVRFIEKEDSEALEAMKLYLNTQVKVESDSYFCDDTEIIPLLEKIEHPELLENLRHIEEQISYIFPEDYFTTPRAHKRLMESLPEFDNAEQTLKALAYDGLESKGSEFEDLNAAIARLEYEVKDIAFHHWEKIFLLHHELVTWGTQNGIEHGPGRGSASGSLVSYLLGITNVNPIKHGLIYERFANPERLCNPDFDIDYDYEQLDKVVNHLKEKYGSENVIKTEVFGTLKCWQVLKIAGKYLNYPDEEIQDITKTIHNCWIPRLSLSSLLDNSSNVYNNDTIPHWDGVKLQGFFRDKKNEKLIKIACCLESVKCNKGLHASGYIVINNSASQYVPVLKDEKTNWLYSEYTFDILEYVGLYKNDLLGLKQLTKLKQLSDEIATNEKVEFDYKSIPLEDESTIEAFAKGSTTDVFQFESPGMKKILKQFKPEVFSALVLMNTMYRPGPMDYIPTIIETKEGCRNRYDFPGCRNILNESYGLPVYQEQIMQIAQTLAGYSLGEADMFRRALGKKKIEVLLAKKAEFIERAAAKGIVNEKQAEEIFEILIPFAGYAFNKSHAVAYTMMAYWEMYIKVHYPREYKKVNKNFKKEIDREEY